MKYPFRFTNKFIVDIDQIASAEIIYPAKKNISLILKTGDELLVNFDTVEDCTERFEDFCNACSEIN